MHEVERKPSSPKHLMTNIIRAEVNLIESHKLTDLPLLSLIVTSCQQPHHSFCRPTCCCRKLLIVQINCKVIRARWNLLRYLVMYDTCREVDLSFNINDHDYASELLSNSSHSSGTRIYYYCNFKVTHPYHDAAVSYTATATAH